MAFSLSSPKFRDHEPIPIEYTREGENVSPPLAWTEVPARTQSLALVVVDPDAPDPEHPQRTFTHWVLYNLPPSLGRLPEDLEGSGLPQGARAGMNDFGQSGYGGPQPPKGNHRYIFQLYALDEIVPATHSLTRGELERRIHGHVLAKAELVGMYESHRRRKAA